MKYHKENSYDLRHCFECKLNVLLNLERVILRTLELFFSS